MAYKKANCRVQMDERKVREALHAIVPPGDLFEIRMLDEKWTKSGYFTDVELAVQELSKTLITENAGIYVTLNHIKSGCGSRKQRDKFLEDIKPTTSDNDIDYYQYLMLDFDPSGAERVSGVSSTDQELSQAREVAVSVAEFLRLQGWPEPLKGMSGNGYHLLYWIEHIPANDQNGELIKKVLKTLNQKFGTSVCKVDEANYNPARICKLYGTVAQKGINSEERPHRTSKLISIPEDTAQVTLDQLEAVAALLKDPNEKRAKVIQKVSAPVSTSSTSNDTDKLLKSCKKYGIRDLGEYLDSIGIAHRDPEVWRTGRKWVLEKCPFDESHTASDSAVFQFADGQLRFKCLHNSCKDYHFAQFIQKVDPERYAAASIEKSEKPSLTIENLAAEYEERGVNVKLNLITHDVEVEADDPDLDYESLKTTTHSILKGNGKSYSGVTWDTLEAYTLELAKQNKFNPVLDYLNSIEYDGKDHFEDLFALMGLDESDTLSRSLVRKWFLQGIVLLHNTEAHPVAPEGVLTLNGPQRCGKTSLIELFSIRPEWFARGAALNPDDKDTIRRCCSRWIIELGEVETTLRRDIEALKNFITNDVDVYRVAYGRSDVKHARRSNLAATCNSDRYLIDPTGNRRWWTVPITKMIRYSDIQAFPIVQLWSQALSIYREQGAGCFRLTGEEYDELEERNNKALKPGKAEDEVNDILASAAGSPYLYKWVDITATDWKGYFDSLKKHDSSTIGRALKKAGIEQRQNGTQRLYSLPVWKEAATHYHLTPKEQSAQFG